MSRKVTVLALGLLTALNVLAPVINAASQQSKATMGNMSYEQLVRDPNFSRAVKSIVEKCRVNVDVAKLQC